VKVELNFCDMFPPFERCHPRNEAGANRKVFTNYFSALQSQFSLYYKDIDVSKFE